MKEEKLIAMYRSENSKRFAEVTERRFESSEDAKKWEKCEKETWERQIKAKYPTGQWFVFSARAVPVVDDIYICVVVWWFDC